MKAERGNEMSKPDNKLTWWDLQIAKGVKPFDLAADIAEAHGCRIQAENLRMQGRAERSPR